MGLKMEIARGRPIHKLATIHENSNPTFAFGTFFNNLRTAADLVRSKIRPTGIIVQKVDKNILD